MLKTKRSTGYLGEEINSKTVASLEAEQYVEEIRKFSKSKRYRRSDLPNNLVNEELFTKINVPGDGSCLFWAAALAYLTPVKYDSNAFQERAGRLFENIDNTELEHVWNFIQTYNPSLDSATIYSDKILGRLVTEKFRGRVIDEISRRPAQYEDTLTINDFLNSKNEDYVTGGTLQEKFRNEFGTEISQYNIDINKLKPGTLSKAKIQEIDNELDKIPDQNKVKQFKLTTYLECMCNPKAWGGNHEVQAISQVLHSNILVFSNGIKHPFNYGNTNDQIQLLNDGELHYNFGLVKAQKLIEAIRNNKPQEAEAYLKLGIDNINYQDEEGLTALHFISQLNYPRVTQLLLGQGADANIKNRLGQTPSEVAYLLGEDGIVDIERQQGHRQSPQDFELIGLLFQEVDSAGSKAADLLDKSFKARFQSMIDQIQSYLHSGEKAGFFPHRVLGWFSSVLDTKLNDKLGIERLHFRFEGARTLKIIAKTELKIHVFIFTEDIEAQHSNSPQTRTRNFEFTTGEFRSTMGRDYAELDARELQIDVIKILKDKYKLKTSKPKSEKDVKSKELYLYLKNDILECKARDVHGKIQTVQIERDELKGFDEIKQFLSKSGKSLSDNVRKELSRITSAKGYTLKSGEEDEKISIKVENKKRIIDQPIDPPAAFSFQEIKRKLNKKDPAGNLIHLEDYIEKLASSDTRQARENLEDILNYIKKVHSNLSLKDNVYGSKAREADQHGFVTGIFDNFRYRYNTKIYPEQFAGRGYADIVLLVRGPNRAVDSVLILIELKAGTEGQVTPSDALRQAIDYIKGLRLNKIRVFTNAGNAIGVGLNLDFTESFQTEIEPIKQPSSPLMEKILTDIRDWDGTQQTKAQLEEQIKNALSSEYHTFPANKETKDHYYLSRDILGQSLLINKIGQDQDNIKKYVYSYGEYPLNWSGGTEYTLSKSPVTTLIFIQSNEEQEKTAFIFHIRESNTKEFYVDKKIPVSDIPGVGKIKNVIEIKMSLKKYEKELSFEDLFEVKQIYS